MHPSDLTHIMLNSERTSLEVRQFHDLISCGICRGYMIDPTTVDFCYHTYCRSCILKHLLRDAYCPDCKASGSGKQISEDNLRPDDIMRALIFKLVPGLYKRECNQFAEFKEEHEDLDTDEPELTEQEFFAPEEPISLSLSYHPVMVQQCLPEESPPVIYLQCPAGLKVQLLQRFLSSKYNIDLEHKQIEIEITYENEVLPTNFTLMDVGYCYKWKRLAPMDFCYRILWHDESESKKSQDKKNISKIELVEEQKSSKSGKSVTFAEDLDATPRSKARGKVSSKSALVTRRTTNITTAPRETEDNSNSPAPAVSTFKSLRSNDMRYSDYPTVTRVKSEPEQEEVSLPSNASIVVSIPSSQLSKSADEGEFELKTANKKAAAAAHQLPKLKIELNSLKSKLTVVPKSAEARLEETNSAQQLDLETYAKNIGLKPIETKPSPNTSPKSSCSSSTNGSSSNGLNEANHSSHRKRKKKHSKEPKDANGKRKKLHAEISSHSDGKMKMKITTAPNHNKHKVDLKRSHSLAGGELASVALTQLKLDEKESSDVLNRTLGEEARSISSLMTANSNSESQSSKSLPASPPLPPSLFKAFTPNPSPSVIPTPTSAVKTSKPTLSPNSRKPTPPAPHFVVPQTPPPAVRQAPHMQRYLSTPSSIASSANKQPKRSLSLDESQNPVNKHSRVDYQKQPTPSQVGASWQRQNPKLPQQMRLYGPDMPKPQMPLLCPASLSLSSPAVSITPRPRHTQISSQSYPLDQMPALEIVRLAPNKPSTPKLSLPPLSPPSTQQHQQRHLMGPPASLPKAGQIKTPTIPAMVKSPPLSVALTGPRSAAPSATTAYRTSPPALINLRNTVPLSFPAKSGPAKKSPATTTTTTTGSSKANGTSAAKTSLREFRPPTTTTSTTKDADILDLSKQSSKAPTSPPVGSTSLEAALNKIKQNISANSNGSTTSAASTAAAAAGDDLQNLHLLSESATAREKISIKFENKPKNAHANAVVRPQNASVRSIPNPSALAFRNQPVTLTKAPEPEKPPKLQLSPNASPASATSPRALTKKPTTIDQVAANLNIRAEAKAAALAEEAPPAKSPELAKTTPPVSKESTTVTVTAASTLLTRPTSLLSNNNNNNGSSSNNERNHESSSMSKPPVQIAATDTLAPVASSA